MRPTQSCHIGSFQFDEGTDGYVQIEAGSSKGLVIAAAVVFQSEQPQRTAGRLGPFVDGPFGLRQNAIYSAISGQRCARGMER
jgi:hypothetical protein